MRKNKILIAAILVIVLLVGMAACSNSSSNVTSTKAQSKSDDISQSTDESSKSHDSSIKSTVKSENTDDTHANSSTSEINDSNNDGKESNDTLSQYSSEKIEYARIWMQLGPNQNIDELNIQHFQAGTPLNPDDDTSANYQEDVIQLAGSRLVDGSVTYSGNGDGTINVYNIPLRWDGNYPAGEEFYADILKNTKLVSIDPGNDEEVIKFIKLLNSDL